MSDDELLIQQAQQPQTPPLAVAADPLVATKSRNCTTCVYSRGVPNGGVFCFRFPPTGLVQVFVDRKTGEQETRIGSQFPAVSAMCLCGEWMSRLAGARVAGRG